MTTYGTIPSPSQPPPHHDWICHLPAMEGVLPYLLVNLPGKLVDLIPRISINMSIFPPNYAIVFLMVLFLRLLWQPESLIVLVIATVAWLFLYFLRDEPLVVLGRLIEDRFVLMGLLLGTVVALAFTHATENIIATLSIGFGVVITHGALMDTPLGDAASDSYSLPYRLADNHTDSNGTTV